eukprot:1147355-Pelagomonas_calceolata.AAC.3
MSTSSLQVTVLHSRTCADGQMTERVMQALGFGWLAAHKRTSSEWPLWSSLPLCSTLWHRHAAHAKGRVHRQSMECAAWSEQENDAVQRHMTECTGI